MCEKLLQVRVSPCISTVGMSVWSHSEATLPETFLVWIHKNISLVQGQVYPNISSVCLHSALSASEPKPEK